MKHSGWLLRRLAVKSLAARSPVDVALFGFGVATATASVVFAATMFTRGDHPPLVNGMQYLELFAQPRGRPTVVASVAAPPAALPAAAAAGGAHPAGRAEPRQPVDMSPIGSIAHSDAEAAPDGGPYHLVAVEPGMAWLRNSLETRVIKPGDVAPGLGRVAAIVLRQGRWTLVDDSGAVLLAADPAGPAAPGAADPFARRMIFGPE